MQYRQARRGRTFVARLEDGESIHEALEGLAEREGVQRAAVHLFGGVKASHLVTGPENLDPPIRPHYEPFDDARELVGFGTIFPCEGRPSLHFHVATGRGREARVGCPRHPTTVFLVHEAVIQELLDLDGERRWDERIGAHLLEL